ncbi:MAG TPA: hypothetical protein VF337_04175 [Candidatus Limnocylindrales bacterium]
MANVKHFIMSVSVIETVLVNPFGIGKPEAVYGLVWITDHSGTALVRKQIDQDLLGLVEILVFVYQDVIKSAAFGRRRICSEKPEGFGNQLPDQHRFVESQPRQQSILKLPVSRIVWPPRRLRLKAGPRGLKRAYPCGAFPLLSE